MLGSIGTMKESEATMRCEYPGCNRTTVRQFCAGHRGWLDFLSGPVANPECSCDAAGPDADGNFDRIPNPECPIHES
jgi:hypothetical protein